LSLLEQPATPTRASAARRAAVAMGWRIVRCPDFGVFV
jgi:hypothetical protein